MVNRITLGLRAHGTPEPDSSVDDNSKPCRPLTYLIERRRTGPPAGLGFSPIEGRNRISLESEHELTDVRRWENV